MKDCSEPAEPGGGRAPYNGLDHLPLGGRVQLGRGRFRQPDAHEGNAQRPPFWQLVALKLLGRLQRTPGRRGAQRWRVARGLSRSRHKLELAFFFFVPIYARYGTTRLDATFAQYHLIQTDRLDPLPLPEMSSWPLDQFLTLEALAYKYGIANAIGLPDKPKLDLLDGAQSQPTQAQPGVELRLDNSAGGAANSDAGYQNDGASAAPDGANGDGISKLAVHAPPPEHAEEVSLKPDRSNVFSML